jgi:Rrf2 family nitric oxide-sensitive transcriptional repressor
VNLKVHTDYALRTLLYLAHRGEQVSVDEIAKAYAISKDHLFKVVQQLVRLGYITSKAGRHGGVKLRRDPAEIFVDKVVADFEGRHGVLACVEDQSVCKLEPGCVLRVQLIKAEAAFYDTLAQMTIADVLKPNAARQSGGMYNLTIHHQDLRAPSGASAGGPTTTATAVERVAE